MSVHGVRKTLIEVVGGMLPETQARNERTPVSEVDVDEDELDIVDEDDDADEVLARGGYAGSSTATCIQCGVMYSENIASACPCCGAVPLAVQSQWESA